MDKNTVMNGNLFILNDASMNGNLEVGRDITILGRLNVKNFTNNNIINTTTNNYQLIVSEDLSLNGRLFVSGNVGIGSANPAYGLDILTTAGNAPLNVKVGTTNALNVTGAGVVIIGTQASTNNAKLEVKQGQEITTINFTELNKSPLKITSYGDSNDALYIGNLSNTGNNGDNPTAYIQNVWDNTSGKVLSLNPMGGHVGIGTTNPGFPLHVSGGVEAARNGSFFFQFGALNVNVNWSRSIAIRAEQSAFCDGFFTFSDKRIKNNIRNFDAFDLLNKLNPVLFSYIDTVNHHGTEYGFIAQEIDDSIFQNSITKSVSFIPNIYEIANVNNSNIIVLQNKNTNDFEKDNSGNFIPKLKLYDASNNEIITNIVSIIDDKRFQIDRELNMDNVFVYGQEIPDFHILKKDEIISVVTAAVKEQQIIIENLQNRLNTLEARLYAAGL